MKNGIYHLIIRFPKKKMIQVGRLGAFLFPKGFYVYTGSAQTNLGKRISRHLSKEKKLHWHIDYLLQFGEIVSVLTIDGVKNRECVCSDKIALTLGGRAVVEKFGSSDCRCKTHLYFFEHTPKIDSMLQGFPKYKVVKKGNFTG
ncbi:MAG: hypothetical protein SCALA701_32670 [Candidatus Scalindua sp.]|nr:MAG: hypothetical protein SCALA701_32670 [Candidatus Scalindua sp.]